MFNASLLAAKPALRAVSISGGSSHLSGRAEDGFMNCMPAVAARILRRVLAATLAVLLSTSLALAQTAPQPPAPPPAPAQAPATTAPQDASEAPAGGGTAAEAPGGPAGAPASLIDRGDAVVTGFSGAKIEGDIPADVHPLDRTFINLDGFSAQIFDLTDLGTAPRGQLSDAPPKAQIKARDIGQVFGVTLDDGDGQQPPNAYLAATSRFGLNLVGPDGKGGMNRLLTGAPNASWMPGQFALDKGGTPGAIYRIDGSTGQIDLLTNVKLNGKDNDGAGLGNITYDGRTQQLFVSDLETGMIHRIGLDGQDLGTFDHGDAGRGANELDKVPFDDTKRVSITTPQFNTEDPATWGYADARRRVFGLGVKDDRLYYSVAEGPSVWSVSIDEQGNFGPDPRIEIDIENAVPGTEITDILFDNQGRMYLSQRGPSTASYDYQSFAAPDHAQVLRYTFDAQQGRWTETPEEYAIGLKPEHQSALGGIALNYGYDKFGKANFGACKQTLWSTGEHLREGEDVVRASTGGAQIVHGLQGNYISRVRPANVPPFETWFTDYDGSFDDAEAFGQVGDVAIYSPCDPAPPQQEAAPLLPPVDDPALVLDKRCFASAIGGKARCTITVRNVGNVPITDPVVIKDVTKVLSGPDAGGPVPVIDVALPDDSIECTAVPTAEFGCTIPGELLPPGQSVAIDVLVDTQELALSGNAGFRNCAFLRHSTGNAKACAEGGTDIVVEKIGPGTCLPGGTCKFGLKIKNTGSMPFNGDILLADAMTVGGAVQNVPVTAVQPPIPCSAGDTNQLPFTCITPLSLMPGEERTHFIDVTMPAPGGFVAQNCFGALDPSLLPAGQGQPGLAPGGNGQNPSCVLVNVPAPKPNLVVSKKVAGDGSCKKVAHGIVCTYDITIANANGSEFKDVIKFEENLPPGAKLDSVNPPFKCSGAAPKLSCQSDTPVVIPAGGSLTTQVSMKIDFAGANALQCKVPNTVKLVSPPGGSPANSDATDDEATAIASMTGIEVEDPVTKEVKVVCDPTNMKVEKVSRGDCIKTGNSWSCSFDITITNVGPDPFKGPVKIAETVGGNPTNVSFGGDLKCSGSGGSFTCETPGAVQMQPGDTLKLSVEASLPDNGTCRMLNTVELTAPAAGSPGNGNGADDIAKASSRVPSEKCYPKQSLIPVIPVPRCDDGRPRLANGTCPCPQGYLYSARYGTCEPPRPTCYDPDRRRDDGTCCPRGTVYYSSYGTCRVPPQRCADPERRRSDGSCCPPGTVVSDGGYRCVVIDYACPPGTRWSYVNRTCVPLTVTCGYGSIYNWRRKSCDPVGPPSCPPGTRYSRGSRSCVPDYGTCGYGQHWSRHLHRCVDDQTGPIACPPGKHRIGRFCIPDTTGKPGDYEPCPPGKRRIGRYCLPDSTGKPGDYEPCPPGKRRIGRFCLPDSTGKPGDYEPCPPGKHRLGRFCVPDGTGKPGDYEPCLPGKHRLGRFCVPDGTGKPGDYEPCPPGKRRLGNVCVPGTTGSGGIVDPDGPRICPPGKHPIGRFCMPDRVPGSDKPTEYGPCPPGKRRLGNVCVPGTTGSGGIVNPDGPRICPPGKHPIGRFCMPDRKTDGGTNSNVQCPPDKRRVGNLCLPGKTGSGGIVTPPDTPRVCPPGRRAVGKYCMPDRIPGGGNQQQQCPPGKHRVGTLCLPGNTGPGGIKGPDYKLPACGPGQQRIGRRCVPQFNPNKQFPQKPRENRKKPNFPNPKLQLGPNLKFGPKKHNQGGGPKLNLQFGNGGGFGGFNKKNH